MCRVCHCVWCETSLHTMHHEMRKRFACGQRKARDTEAAITQPSSPLRRYSSNFNVSSSDAGVPIMSYPNWEQTFSYASALSSGSIMSSLPSFSSMRVLQVVSPHGNCHQNYSATTTGSANALLWHDRVNCQTAELKPGTCNTL